MEDSVDSFDNLKLLVVEDNRADYVYVCEMLREINQLCFNSKDYGLFAWPAQQVDWVPELSQALKLLEEQSFDLILLDLSLPDSDGTNSLVKLRKARPDVPVIIMSGHSEATLALDAVRLGAQDYLVKGQFAADQLARSIRYTLERARIQGELDKNAKYKSQFLANMSHELRTPVTSILGFSELLQEELPPHSPFGLRIETIARNAKHLLGILDDILDYTRIEAGKLALERTEVSLYEVIETLSDLIQPLAQKSGIHFEVIIEGILPQKIHTDPLRLKQILLNLLGNAVKFTKHGSVKLELKYQFAEQQLLVRVRDTGIGIEADKQKTLFEPFVQSDPSNARKYGGSGLGLSITSDLVRLFGGNIQMQSEVGQGTVFIVSIPAEVVKQHAESSNDRKHTELVQTTEDKMHGRVLLAEDTPDTRELIGIILKRMGFEVETAADGNQAVLQAMNGKFDLVLMDMHMPGLDGYSATRLLREKGFKNPIVALTARVTGEVRKECIDCGCNDYISKPIHRDDFQRVLQSIINLNNGKRRIESQAETTQQEDPEIERVFQSYRQELPSKTCELRQAYTRQDWHSLKEQAHKLSNAEMFGLPEITRMAREMEKAAFSRELGRVESALRELEQYIQNN